VEVLLQRVTQAAVDVAGERIAAIGAGLLIFVGVMPSDTREDAQRLADRALDLRIFADAAKPMNRSVVDVGGEVLVVSQFTLAADTRRGRRPSFDAAAPPELAKQRVAEFTARVRERLGAVAEGRFGADMQVSLVNDGPVTFRLS